MTAGDLAQIEQSVARQVEEAMEFALSSPRPGPEDITTDIYADTY